MHFYRRGAQQGRTHLPGWLRSKRGQFVSFQDFNAWGETPFWFWTYLNLSHPFELCLNCIWTNKNSSVWFWTFLNQFEPFRRHCPFGTFECKMILVQLNHVWTVFEQLRIQVYDFEPDWTRLNHSDGIVHLQDDSSSVEPFLNCVWTTFEQCLNHITEKAISSPSSKKVQKWFKRNQKSSNRVHLRFKMVQNTFHT